MPGKHSRHIHYQELIMEFTYRCLDCSREYPGDRILYVCPDCSAVRIPGEFQTGLLEVVLDLGHHSAGAPVDVQDFLPFPLPHADAYPVGGTPLARPIGLSEKYGFTNLFCKLDSLNPSGSYKDRASQLIAAQAVFYGETRITLSSTGNAGSAMACAGAAYGLEIILFVPETAPKNKLMQSVLFGAAVVPIRGSYDQAFTLSIAFTEQFGGINRNTAYNPMTVEGKKSCAIELYKQFGNSIPDIVYIPVGDGVIYSGMYKGFRDLRDAGLIERLPKLVCVQSERSDAVSRAWRTAMPVNIEKADTVADSISVSSPAGGRYALKGLQDTGGWCTVLPDEAILEAQLELSRDAGIFAEPAAAAAWAGFINDSEMLKDTWGNDVKIAVLITGSGFKDMDVFRGRIRMPDSVEPTLAACAERFSFS